nr:HupE/UreJ family protein [Paracoccus marinaquae]
MAAVLVLLVPGAASAHGNLAAAGAFYSGLLHPLLVPAELLCLLAVGLYLGTNGRHASQIGVPVFAGFVAAGLALGGLLSLPVRLPTIMALAAAALASLSVIAGKRLPHALLAVLAGFGGLAIGLDAVPDADGWGDRLLTSVATVIGSGAAIVILTAFVSSQQRELSRIGYRVAGSWIMAVAILYFGWLAVQ